MKNYGKHKPNDLELTDKSYYINTKKCGNLMYKYSSLNYFEYIDLKFILVSILLFKKIFFTFFYIFINFSCYFYEKK